jgi:DNA polymerase/3'-5' exonuclease PolX
MNQVIIDEFRKLVKQAEAELLSAHLENDATETIKQKFRVQQLKRVLNILKKFPYQITNIDDVKNISGIGKGSLKRIQEILSNGTLSEIENKFTGKKQKLIKGIQELEQVIGIGPQRAKILVTKYNITSVDDLKNKYKKKLVPLNDKILLGLKYYGIVKNNIPRAEIDMINKYLMKVASSIDKELGFIICGSYRRGKSTSNDIDCLLYHPTITKIKQIEFLDQYKLPNYLKLFVDKLIQKEFLVDSLTDKKVSSKYMGFCKFNSNPIRRIDIRMVPIKSYYSAILYFTGPAELNTAMRKMAIKRKMLLNEYGLYIIEHGKKIRIPTNSEKEIFDLLGMDYLTPEQREQFNTGKKMKD